MTGVGGGLKDEPEQALASVRERWKGKDFRRRPPARWSVKVHLGKHGVGAARPVTVPLHGFLARGHWSFPSVLNMANSLFISTDNGTAPEDLIVKGQVVQQLGDRPSRRSDGAGQILLVQPVHCSQHMLPFSLEVPQEHGPFSRHTGTIRETTGRHSHPHRRPHAGFRRFPRAAGCRPGPPGGPPASLPRCGRAQRWDGRGHRDHGGRRGHRPAGAQLSGTDGKPGGGGESPPPGF